MISIIQAEYHPNNIPKIALANNAERCENCASCWRDPIDGSPDFNYCGPYIKTQMLYYSLNNEQRLELKNKSLVCPFYIPRK